MNQPPKSQSDVQAVWQKIRPLVLQRIEAIEEVVTCGFSASASQEQVGTATGEAHKLHGTLGSFGYPKGSRLASQIESGLRDVNQPEQAYALSMLLQSLRDNLQEAPELPSSEMPAQRSRVWLLGQGGLALAALRAHLEMEVQEQWPDPEPPDLILMDPLELSAIAEIHLRFPNTPILALTQGELSDELRLQALQAGVLRLIPQQTEAEALAEEAWRLAHLDRAQAWVLALDDDPLALKVLERLLLGQGVKLEAVKQAQAFWHSLNRRRPDIVLLDLEMPDFSGQEICQLLRSNPITEDIPVMVITANEDPVTLENLYAYGVDDCLHKPIRSRELMLRIRNRLDRVQAIRRHSLQEAETGAWSLQHGKPLALRMLRLAERSQTPLTMAVVKFSEPSQATILRLSRSLRGEDLVCRWREEHLLLGLYGSSAADSLARLRAIFSELESDFGVKSWVGLAEYPSQGNSFELLVERARACVEILSARDVSGVLGYADLNIGTTSELLDVLLVEDDALLGEIVLHSLNSRNLKCQWIQDGDEALQGLTGQLPALRPRVLVLDVDLPGASGLEILRQLRHDGALRRTRVIMLTVRSNEAETLETLTLGAYDHLAKPCSLQILMQRVNLALYAP